MLEMNACVQNTTEEFRAFAEFLLQSPLKSDAELMKKNGTVAFLITAD